MRTVAIESNGLIERTAVYINGQCIGGIRELMIHLSEDGDFDSVITYKGTDGQIRTKELLVDYLENLQVLPPPFTEEEAAQLQLLEIETDGDIDSTVVYWNGEPLTGIVDLLIHIREGGTPSRWGKFLGQQGTGDQDVFVAEITFREEDGSLTTERIFG